MQRSDASMLRLNWALEAERSEVVQPAEQQQPSPATAGSGRRRGGANVQPEAGTKVW